ncbi:MAG: YdeI/OmpD-associated family protein [Planctomycetota bacterium]|nr:YdeI/OmpD-associated family protein [Planctomycetota bacterium]
MGTKDPRVDAYIKKSAPFAQPILTFIRELMHEGCPDVVETIKWGMPSFTHQGMLAGMAAFKQHCALGFWKEKVLAEVTDASFAKSKEAMGSFGKVASLKDLPARKHLLALVKKAAALNEAGVKKPAPDRTAPKPKLVVPADLKKALAKSSKAAAVFKAFTYGKQKEYIQWSTEAKTQATRDKRLAQAVEWIGEGKSRNWKYENC